MPRVPVEERMTFSLDENRQWLQQARRVSSPNCDERPAACEVDAVIIHGISLPPNEYGGPYIDQLFTNALDPDEHPYFDEIKHLRVSSHLLIDRQGKVSQYVPFDRRAWHAGESCLGDRKACNDFSIGIELEGRDDEDYEAIQYEKAAAVVRLLMGHFPGIRKEQVVGHADVAPGRKTDPGEALKWDYF